MIAPKVSAIPDSHRLPERNDQQGDELDDDEDGCYQGQPFDLLA